MYLEQIYDYANSVKEIQASIEKEFEEAFFFPLKFKDMKRLIIAPREFYKSYNKSNFQKYQNIDFGHYRDKDITKREPKKIVNIHLQKK